MLFFLRSRLEGHFAWARFIRFAAELVRGLALVFVPGFGRGGTTVQYRPVFCQSLLVEGGDFLRLIVGIQRDDGQLERERVAPKSKLPRGLIFVLVSMRPCSRIDRQSNILGAGFRVEVNARALRALSAR